MIIIWLITNNLIIRANTWEWEGECVKDGGGREKHIAWADRTGEGVRRGETEGEVSET